MSKSKTIKQLNEFKDGIVKEIKDEFNLTEIMQIVTIQAYKHGFSVCDIASVTGCSEGTLYRWLRHDPVEYERIKEVRRKNIKNDSLRTGKITVTFEK